MEKIRKLKSFVYFYPRSPCGERPVEGEQVDKIDLISIHALLAESDCLWGLMGGLSYISIHALLAESDLGCRIYDMSAA